MLLNLRTPASAAASHQHEFSPSPKPGMTQADPQALAIDLFSPLRYLHGRWQALAGPDPVSADHDASADSNSQSPPVSPFPAVDGAAPSPSDDLPEPCCTALATDASAACDTSSIRSSIACGKTSYQLCLPPPKAGRLHLRRRLLLQLRRTHKGHPAAPALELFATSALSRTMTKSRARKPSLFSFDDLVITSCESSADGRPNVDADPSETSDDEAADPSGVVAFIAQGSHVTAPGGSICAEIRIGHEQWRVMQLQKGYEFTRMGDDSPAFKARWIGKAVARPRSQTEPTAHYSRATAARVAGGLRFILLSPTCRRHPVVAHLDRTALHVMDQYLVPEAPTPQLPTAATFSASTVRHASH